MNSIVGYLCLNPVICILLKIQICISSCRHKENDSWTEDSWIDSCFELCSLSFDREGPSKIQLMYFHIKCKYCRYHIWQNIIITGQPFKSFNSCDVWQAGWGVQRQIGLSNHIRPPPTNTTTTNAVSLYTTEHNAIQNNVRDGLPGY